MQCVVGARGFLGTALSRRLAAEGCATRPVLRGASWQVGSEDTLAGVDVVYWLAGSVNPATADANPQRIADDLATVRDFAAAVRRSGVRRVVLASSGGTVYDVGLPPPYSEASAISPLSAYGRFKLAQEEVLAEDLPPDVELVTLRIGNAYGPGQPVGTGQGVIAYWLDAALTDRPLVLIGAPDTTRDFTYIDDVAAALLHFGRVPIGAGRSVFNIGSGVPTQLGTLAETIMGVAADPGLHVESRPARPFDVPHMWLDVTAANAAGWRAATSLQDGITRSWHALTAQVPA